MVAVGVVVGVLGHDADDGKRVQKRVERLVEADFHRRVVRGHGLLHHGQVALGRLGVPDAVEGEGHVARRERLAVGELHVVADGERPRQAVGRRLVGRGQVVLEAQLGGGGDQRGLDERLVHVLAAAPRHQGVEAGRRLRSRRHGHDHLLGRVGARRDALLRFRVALACVAIGARRQQAAQRQRRRARARQLRELPSSDRSHGILPVRRAPPPPDTPRAADVASRLSCYVSKLRNTL